MKFCVSQYDKNLSSGDTLINFNLSNAFLIIKEWTQPKKLDANCKTTSVCSQGHSEQRNYGHACILNG